VPVSEKNYLEEILMKTKFLRGFGFLTALVLLCFTVLTGCPVETTEDEPFPSKLVGNWSLADTSAGERTFVISKDGSFAATLNPGAPGTVTGKLRFANGEYQMNNMQETTGATWGSAVTAFNGTWVQITLSNSDNTFTLECDSNPAVTQFFGGSYTRQQQP
jgi:hypothetical protein